MAQTETRPPIQLQDRRPKKSVAIKRNRNRWPKTVAFMAMNAALLGRNAAPMATNATPTGRNTTPQLGFVALQPSSAALQPVFLALPGSAGAPRGRDVAN